MKIVEKRMQEVKEKISEITGAEGIETRTELIQQMVPVVLDYVKELLKGDVERIAGLRYSRCGGSENASRWGRQAGSICLQDMKVPVMVPRVRDTVTGKEIQLDTYKSLQKRHYGDKKLMKRLIHGLSCRNYEECAEMVPGVFGLKPSTVSHRYIRASSRKLRELMERRLEGQDIVAMFIDGKTFADDEIVIAMGVKMSGEKILLGMVQTGTENERVISRFLEELKDRGLQYNNGILFVIDGSKGFRKAIRKSFGEYGVIQRCLWHKRENVVSYLPKGRQKEFRYKLQGAYEKPTYSEAKESLLRIKADLEQINESSARSLEEGLEETLTLHRLEVFRELGISLKTANCMESIMSQVERKTSRVSYWKNSHQKMRWVAAALLEIEPRLRIIKGYRHLILLRTALQNQIKQKLGVQEVA